MSSENSSLESHLKVIAVAIVAVALTLVVQIGGFVSPGWTYVDLDVNGVTYQLHEGLWYTVYCISGESCKTEPTPKRANKDAFLEMEIEVPIALVSCMVSLICLFCHMCRRSRNMSGEVATFLVVAIIGLITSGILAMIAAGKRGHFMRTTLVADLFSFPYALFLTGLGGVLAALIGLYLVFAVHQVAVANKNVPKGSPATYMYNGK